MRTPVFCQSEKSRRTIAPPGIVLRCTLVDGIVSTFDCTDMLGTVGASDACKHTHVQQVVRLTAGVSCVQRHRRRVPHTHVDVMCAHGAVCELSSSEGVGESSHGWL